MNTPKDSTGGCCPPPLCSQIPLLRGDLQAVIEKYGEQNTETGSEDFCEPWWDAELGCWCVSCRYADCGLRQYADGWEYALDGKRWKTAIEAYEHRNDRFLSANDQAQEPAAQDSTSQ